MNILGSMIYKMGKDNISVHFKNSSGVYYPGQIVDGDIKLDVRKKLKLTVCLSI